MSVNVELSEGDYPGLYQAADTQAISSQRKYYQSLMGFLYFLLIGAVIALFSGESKWFAILAAVFFLGSLLLSMLMAVRRYDRTWYSARAIAESVKTRTWRYMMRSEPYGASATEEEPRRIFLSDLQEILSQNREVTKELCHESAIHAAITSKMEQIRRLGLKDRIAFYQSYRIENQRDWYSRKARLNKKQVRNWFIAIVVMNAFAVICLLVRIAFPSWKYLPIEVFAVAAACVVSWFQTKRFNELSTSYSLAALEITIIHAEISDITSEDQFSVFVNDAENAFSREHTQWVARRDT